MSPAAVPDLADTAGRPAPTGAELRRHRILEAAGRLLAEKGYAALTTADVARVAQVSKRDIYAAFGTKAGILSALISDRAAQMSPAAVLPAPTDRASFQALLIEFGAAFLERGLATDTMALTRLAVAEAENEPELARILRDSGRRPVTRTALRMFAAANRAGLIGSLNARSALRVWFGLLAGDLPTERLLGLRRPPGPRYATVRATWAARILLATIDGCPAGTPL